MAQVRAALGAHGFHPAHAVAQVHALFNGPFGGRLVKARPAAARIELGVRLEQLGVAADAAVNAAGPVALVFAGEGPLGGRLAGDGLGHRLGAFGGQQLAPLLFCFGDLAHDEQLISS